MSGLGEKWVGMGVLLVFVNIKILFTFIFVWCVAWVATGGVRWVSGGV